MKLYAKMTTAAIAVCLAGPSAASNCAPREMVIENLAKKYGESRQSMGLGANNAVVEVFASEETGTWTITVTSVHGMTCMVASGQAFEELAEVLPVDDNDA
ncbi:hypothetical protein [Roseovarius phycicola]|uniref:Uncharacterized protein n=1 Tax=Roseovarius phycicola TaxID=3080976 RepID=A0ABZ2HJG6_9RHOB